MARFSVTTLSRAKGEIAILVMSGCAAYAAAQTPAPTAPAAAPASAHAPTAASTASAHASAPASGKHMVAPIAIEKPLWKDLNPAQQHALEPLAGEWNKLEGLRKQKWLEIANRFSSMKPDEQQRVHERMRDWIRLTPDQRRQVRENFARAQKITPGQKSAQWEQYQQLPEEQKKQLADKAPKKQVVNPPTLTQSKIQMVQPVKKHPATITPPPGALTVAPGTGAATAAAAAGAPAATPAPVNTAPAPAPAVPPNVK
jgi:hypothetical protein